MKTDPLGVVKALIVTNCGGRRGTFQPQMTRIAPMPAKSPGGAKEFPSATPPFVPIWQERFVP
jgi:hypothetical protein